MKLHLWPTLVLNTFLICIWQCNGKKQGLWEFLILKNFSKHDMRTGQVLARPQETKQKIVSLLFNYFSSNKIEFMDLDNMERIDWKKPKWDRVTQRQKRNLAKLLSNQTSRVLLVYLVFFVFTLVEKSSQSVNRSDVAKSKSFQFSPFLISRHVTKWKEETLTQLVSRICRKTDESDTNSKKSESQDFEVLSSRIGKKTCR